MKERIQAYLSERCPPILKRFTRDERGANMVIFAIGLMVLMGFSGIAVDGGNLYYQQQRMQIAADAAALGGARALANGELEAIVDLEIENLALANGADIVKWNYIAEGRGVHVQTEHIFDSYFAKLYGYDTFTVSANADAQYEPVSATDNLFPMTFSCNCVDGGESSYPTEDPGGDDSGSSGGSCPLLPIAFYETTALDAEPGDYLTDIYNGIQPGNFGWLSWVGDTSAPSLEMSLDPPSDNDSRHYIDPDTGIQEPFTLDGYESRKVMGLPGVTNSSGVRSKLDALIDQDIMVPLWRSTSLQGANAYYEITGFAVVKLLDYNIPHKWISARFIALVDSCEDYQPGFSTVSMGDATTSRYDISLVNRTNESEGGQTWTYKVNKLWGNDLYSWGIELLPSCSGKFINLVDDDMGTASFVDNYVSWSLPPGFTEGEFSFTVDTRYVAAPVNVSAEDYDGFTYDTLAGPNCNYPVGGSSTVVITNPDEDPDALGVCLPSLDFESDDSGGSLGRGDKIDNEWTAWGVHVTSDDPVNHPIMIFDSSHPTGGDYDLGTPNQDFGGPGIGSGGKYGRPGQNDQALGNILIISEDGDGNDPDDNADGGTMIFTFDLAVRMDDVYIVDTDDDEAGGEVRAYSDLEGTDLLASNKGLGLGDNSLQAIPINAIGVRRLEIDLPSSGGVPAVVSCRNQDSNLYSIGDKVWQDEDADGIQDFDEPGIADVTMELRIDGMSQLVAQTTTDSSGKYQFANLPAGDYRITIAPDNFSWGGELEGAVFTTKNVGEDTMDSDFDSSSTSVVATVPKNGVDNPDVDAGFSITSDSSECSFCEPCTWPYLDCDEPAPESVTLSFKDWHKKTAFDIEWVRTVGNTWTYRVREVKGNDLTSWNLGIDNCLDHVEGYSPGGATIGFDIATWFNGIKWGVDSSFTDAEFSFTLDGNYDSRTVDVLAKAAYDSASGEIKGPDCTAPIEVEEPDVVDGGDDGSSVVEQEGSLCEFRWLDWDGGTTSNLELQQYIENTELSGSWRIGDEVAQGPVVSSSTLIDSSLAEVIGDEIVIPLTEWNGEGFVVCGFTEVKLLDHNLTTNPISLSIEMLQGLKRSSDTDPDATDYGSRDIIMLD